ncbi:MAG TPA: GNAT family N-acetyltransferase [Candidatus Competibacteraceae bacterium]|nr:GNAT family N-acetyltransferase [Candidatus Competibacteraceae bacterium]
MSTVDELLICPLTAERWADLEELFGPNGACAGCWCMWWRLSRAEFERQKGKGNRAALRALVEGGTMPGLLAYAGERAVGWCAVQPRAAYPALARSRILAPVDDTPVWSVTCFYTRKGWRGQGVSLALLRAAVEHVRALGGRVLEGYPIEPRRAGKAPAALVWSGLASAFRQAGFEEVARRSPTQPIMRYRLVDTRLAGN